MRLSAISPLLPPTTPHVDAARCKGCGLCALACPCQAIEMVDDLPVFHCQETCHRSAQCVAIVHGLEPCELACPAQAINCVVEIRRASS